MANGGMPGGDALAAFAKGHAEVFDALDGMNRAQKLLADGGENFLASQLYQAELRVLVVAYEITEKLTDRRRRAEDKAFSTPEGAGLW